MIATRRTAADEAWELCPGVSLTERAGEFFVQGGHILEALNAALARIDGVHDGVFYLRDGAERLGALVVAPHLGQRALRAALRRHIDPAFLPRPLHIVAALPRNESGKLTRQRLLELVDSLESVSS